MSPSPEYIEFKKLLNNIKRIAQDRAKPKNCILCGNKCTSFCNSHSVPQSVLKNITTNGYVFVAGKILSEEIFDSEKGIKNSGVFRVICNDCDGKYFKNYENPDNLVKQPTDRTMAEIALKNSLLEYSKKLVASKMNEVLIDSIGGVPKDKHFLRNLNKTYDLDIIELKKEISLYKNIIDKKNPSSFNLIYWLKLPYSTPIASQCRIVLTHDRCGKQLNNVKDLSPDVRMQAIHLSVFPYDNNTYISLFFHSRDSIYQDFKSQFDNVELHRNLSYINWLLFEYTENFFISKKTIKFIEKDSKLKKLCYENAGEANFGLPFGEPLLSEYESVNESEITNLLELDVNSL